LPCLRSRPGRLATWSPGAELRSRRGARTLAVGSASAGASAGEQQRGAARAVAGGSSGPASGGLGGAAEPTAEQHAARPIRRRMMCRPAAELSRGWY